MERPPHSLHSAFPALLLLALAGAISCSEGATPASPTALGDGGPSFAAGGGSGPTVKATDPDSATVDTTLDVRVLGSGFDRGSRAQWAFDGVVDETRVRINSTRYVSSRELVANITISTTANIGLWDVIVTTSTGKPGIGTEMFEVTVKATDLGTLGGTSSEAYAINNNGEIVGYSTTSSGAGRAFFRTAGGTMADIGPGRVEDVNNSRQVVGYTYDASLGASRAFVRTVDANGVVTSAVDLGIGVARAINNAGQIAGEAGGRAVVWLSPADRIELPTLGGLSYAYDISDDTLIVGASHHDHAGTDIEHAVRWRRAVINGAPVWVLDTLDQATESDVAAAWAINSVGDIAGSGRPCGGCLGPFAYLWPAAGGRMELGTLSNIQRAAFGINDSGTAVGYCHNKQGKRAALWLAGGGVRDLGALRAATAAEARDINASGHVVGWSEFSGGKTLATLWIGM